MQLHLVIEDSGEITRDTCWYAFRRCLNLRTISIDGQVWSVSQLTSATHLCFGKCSAAAATIFAPFVATNLALESLTLTGVDGRAVCHPRAWLHKLRGHPASAASAAAAAPAALAAPPAAPAAPHGDSTEPRKLAGWRGEDCGLAALAVRRHDSAGWQQRSGGRSWQLPFARAS